MDTNSPSEAFYRPDGGTPRGGRQNNSRRSLARPALARPRETTAGWPAPAGRSRASGPQKFARPGLKNCRIRRQWPVCPVRKCSSLANWAEIPRGAGLHRSRPWSGPCPAGDRLRTVAGPRVAIRGNRRTIACRPNGWTSRSLTQGDLPHRKTSVRGESHSWRVAFRCDSHIYIFHTRIIER